MHYDSPHNTKKRTLDGDLFADGTRIQPAPLVQCYGPFLGALSGRDPLRVMRAARDADDERDPYGWWRK